MQGDEDHTWTGEKWPSVGHKGVHVGLAPVLKDVEQMLCRIGTSSRCEGGILSSQLSVDAGCEIVVGDDTANVVFDFVWWDGSS